MKKYILHLTLVFGAMAMVACHHEEELVEIDGPTIELPADSVTAVLDTLAYLSIGGDQSVQLLPDTFAAYRAMVREEGYGWCYPRTDYGAPKGEFLVHVLTNITGQRRECIVDCIAYKETDSTELVGADTVSVVVTQNPNGFETRLTVEGASIDVRMDCYVMKVGSDGTTQRIVKNPPLVWTQEYTDSMYYRHNEIAIERDDTGWHFQCQHADHSAANASRSSASFTIDDPLKMDLATATLRDLQLQNKFRHYETLISDYQLTSSAPIAMTRFPGKVLPRKELMRYRASFELTGKDVRYDQLSYTRHRDTYPEEYLDEVIPSDDNKLAIDIIYFTEIVAVHNDTIALRKDE